MRFVRLLILVSLCLFPAIARAQTSCGSGYTQVTGTYLSYANGSVSAGFINQSSKPQLPLLNGSVFATFNNTNFDSAGTFSFCLADNQLVQPTPSQWKITACQKGGSAPACCSQTVTITGATQAISLGGCPVTPNNFIPTNGGQAGLYSYAPGRVWVDARTFGAVCDGSTDDTTAIQTAINTAKTNSSGVGNVNHFRYVHLPSGTCKFTKSLDLTISTWPDGAVCLVGDGKGQALANGNNGNTTLLDDLSEPYVALDFGGDTFGCLKDLTLVRASTSQSVGGILVDQGTTGNVQGGQHFLIDDIYTLGYDGVAGVCSLAMPGVDEESITNSQFDGVVLGWSLGKCTATASKFYTLSSFLPNTNTTRVTLSNVSSCGDQVPGLQLTGSASYTGTGLYFCAGGQGRSGMIVEITNGAPLIGVPISALHLQMRTENQSTATGVTAVMFGTRVGGGELTGEIQTDSAGFDFGTEGTTNPVVNLLQLRDLAPTQKALNITAGWTFSNDKIFLGEGLGAIGTINSGSSWQNDDIYLPSSFNGTSSQTVLGMFPTGSTLNVFSYAQAPLYAAVQTNFNCVWHSGTCYVVVDENGGATIANGMTYTGSHVLEDGEEVKGNNWYLHALGSGSAIMNDVLVQFGSDNTTPASGALTQATQHHWRYWTNPSGTITEVNYAVGPSPANTPASSYYAIEYGHITLGAAAAKPLNHDFNAGMPAGSIMTVPGGAILSAATPPVVTNASVTVGKAACIKVAGVNPVIGYCSTQPDATGACTCN